MDDKARNEYAVKLVKQGIDYALQKAWMSRKDSKEFNIRTAIESGATTVEEIMVYFRTKLMEELEGGIDD